MLSHIVLFICCSRESEKPHRRGARAGHSKSRHAQKGFTLVELLFAIVIFSVLAGLSLPHLGALSTQFNLDNGARAIAMALNQARVQAITRGHTVDVTFESHAFTILDVSNSDEIIAVGNIPSNVSVAFTDDVATFTPLGAAVSPLTVTITNAEGARDVSIGLSGEIQIL